MPKSPNQKMKPLLLQRILLERTDEDHGLTVPELIALLEEEGVAAERKSVYSDLQTLADFGLDIVKRKESGKVVYYVGARTFELPELKLLVDAVQSSRFITHKKSNQLIQKVEGFASRYQAQQLQRQVFVANRVKTMNESIYINVDKIYEAIAANRCITYRYLDWAFRDGAAGGYEKQFRRQGKTYRVSPWSLCWADERYYMIGFSSGLIYALMEGMKPEDTVNFAVASSVMKHAIRGDTNITDKESILRLMNQTYDIQR